MRYGMAPPPLIGLVSSKVDFLHDEFQNAQFLGYDNFCFRELLNVTQNVSETEERKIYFIQICSFNLI